MPAKNQSTGRDRVTDRRKIWRSQLYVPANNPRFIDKAHTRGADAYILDLEDSVPASVKAAARVALGEAVPNVKQSGADALVRINRPLRWAVDDIAAAVAAGADGLLLPKCESADHVRLLAETAADCEHDSRRPPGDVGLIVLIETAAAFFRAAEIAAADAHMVGLALGTEDIAADVGMVPAPETLLAPKQTVIFAARAAGVTPYGLVGTVADYKNLDKVRRIAELSRSCGARGAACIHPTVVPVLNEVFSPSAEAIAEAERILAAYEEATDAGIGAITVDGKMIDVPVVERARKLLAEARQFAER